MRGGLAEGRLVVTDPVMVAKATAHLQLGEPATPQPSGSNPGEGARRVGKGHELAGVGCRTSVPGVADRAGFRQVHAYQTMNRVQATSMVAKNT